MATMRPAASHGGDSLRKAAAALADGLVDLVLPAVCCACGCHDELDGGLCRACRLHLLSLIALASCPRCGGTLGPNIPPREDGCGQCRTALPRFGLAFRLGPYAGPLRAAIRGLKYRGRLGLRRRMVSMLAERIQAGSAADGVNARPGYDVVQPVPMHWLRRLGRGFDHALAIAAPLAGRLGVPLGCELVRVRNTPPQVRLSRTRRIENVQGAFAARDPAALAGAAVLLVDDVTTTGATANEAARVLLRAGAASVTLAVLAKSEPPRAYAHCRP